MKVPRPEVMAKHLFRIVWQIMSQVGWCDEWGSAEQQRVFREWVAAEYPIPVADFIRERANISSEVK